MLKGSKMTKESRQKMSLSKLGVKRPDISLRLKGKPISECHKIRIGLSKLGKKRPPFSQEWLNNLSKAQIGRKHSKETKLKMSGENNWLWKGDRVSYQALHNWVARHRGRPCKCEFCNFEDITKPRFFNWANKSGKYLRDLDDWFRLCVPCHKLLDEERKNAK